jgi:hypothetical protein
MKIKLSIFVFLLLLIVGTLGVFAVPDRESNQTRSFEVSNFDKIYLKGGYKVFLEQSGKSGLRIKAGEEAFDFIDVASHNGTLEVEITKTYLNFNCVELYISFVDLTELHVEGGIKLETAGFIDLHDFYLHVEGGAKIVMGMKVDHLTAVGEGGASFEFKGVAKKFDARISGVGYLDADELTTGSVTFKIEGIGGGSVHATEFLDATVEGVGKIRYKGNPEVEKAITGIGLVEKD